MPIEIAHHEGETFGRWTLLRHVGVGRWLARCACGTERDVPMQMLRRKRQGSVSCGCYRRELARKQATKHGLLYLYPAEYRIWKGMKVRCLNSHCKAFPNYGGRGIRICDRWLKFEGFFADMGPRPSDRHEIDRVNNDGDYESSNCRWSTREEQANNKRSNRLITVNGVTLTMTQWARRSGLHYSTIWERLRGGASPSEAVASHS